LYDLAEQLLNNPMNRFVVGVAACCFAASFVCSMPAPGPAALSEAFVDSICDGWAEQLPAAHSPP